MAISKYVCENCGRTCSDEDARMEDQNCEKCPWCGEFQLTPLYECRWCLKDVRIENIHGDLCEDCIRLEMSAERLVKFAHKKGCIEEFTKFVAGTDLVYLVVDYINHNRNKDFEKRAEEFVGFGTRDDYTEQFADFICEDVEKAAKKAAKKGAQQ